MINGNVVDIYTTERKYDVVVADPPWVYSNSPIRSGKNGSLDYKSMRVADICALPVRRIVHNDAALFLWTTSSQMPVALDVIAAWGFRFVRVDTVWVKTTAKGNFVGPVGAWGMTYAEFILLGVRGKMCHRQAIRNWPQVQLVKRTRRHSEKPASIMEAITRRFGEDAKAIELFARGRRRWDVWGDEAEGEPERRRTILPTARRQPAGLSV